MQSRTVGFFAICLFAGVALPFQGAAQSHTVYKLIDVGTLRGQESYVVPAGAIGSHTQLNMGGTLVGGGGTPIPLSPTSDPAAISCGGIEGFIPFVNHAIKWENGQLIDLGSLEAPSNCSVATSINAKGEISGRSEDGLVDPVTGFNESHAVLWKDGQVLDLGTFGGSVSSGSGINAVGQVAGFALNGVPDPVSIYHFQIFGSSNGTQTRAFLWTNGVMRDLGTLGGPDAWSNVLNDRGQVTGFSYTNAEINPATGVPTTHPFFWDEANGMIDLGTLGGTLAGSEIRMDGGLNNLGQVVGGSTLAGDAGCPHACKVHPFLWTRPGPMKDLGTLGGDNGGAEAVNDSGWVIGTADLPGGNSSHAFLWKDGVMSDLGVLGNDRFSSAAAINAQGQIVGRSCLRSCELHRNTRAVLWENGAIFDLNNLVAGRHPQLVLTIASAINDRGEIAGMATSRGCISDNWCGHAFVLIPCKEGDADCGE